MNKLIDLDLLFSSNKICYFVNDDYTPRIVDYVEEIRIFIDNDLSEKSFKISVVPRGGYSEFIDMSIGVLINMTPEEIESIAKKRSSDVWLRNLADNNFYRLCNADDCWLSDLIKLQKGYVKEKNIALRLQRLDNCKKEIASEIEKIKSEIS